MNAIVPIIILICVLGIGALIFRIVNILRRFSRTILNTDNIIEGISNLNLETQNTPKSISSMTRIYLPQISEDFPEFHYSEMRERAESLLASYFLAINNASPSILTEGTEELKNQLSMRIKEVLSQNKKEKVENFKIHQTEITSYNKLKGKIIITFQSAVQHSIYITDQNNQILDGDKDNIRQTLYNTSVYYIQNPDLIMESKEHGIGLTCPNCGAPINSLGLKFCSYCGSRVVEVNRFVWIFGEIVEDSKYL